MNNAFFEITLVLSVAALLSIVFRLLKQPSVLAYILTGIILGPLGFFYLQNRELMQIMAEMGITFLLFMLGLELKIGELKTYGKAALIAGIGQIVFTSIIGYFISIALGYSAIVSLYIAIALTFSSTIIIVKLLTDKKDINSLYGKISVGFLLVQDFAAILILVLLSGFTLESNISIVNLGLVLIKGAVLFSVVYFISKSIFPMILSKVAHSVETLFLFSIAWMFALSSIVASPFIGFSIEIGGLLAGLSLANSVQSTQIASRVRPLRDFFITLFFVTLGINMAFGDISKIWVEAGILSLFVLIGNPIIVMLILGLMGYKKRTGFLAGLTVAQISEFSIIVVIMGNRIGHVSSEIVSLITLVGIITFTVSTYMIINGNNLYVLLSRYLSVFEIKGAMREQLSIQPGLEAVENHVIVVGGAQMGLSLVEALEKTEKSVVVVDFDPSILSKFAEKNIFSVYGDIGDQEIQDKLRIDQARLIISTVPDVEDNMILIKNLKKINKKAKVIVMAYEAHEARELYKQGADYVVLPHLAGGRQIAHLLKRHDLGEGDLEELKDSDKKYLGI